MGLFGKEPQKMKIGQLLYVVKEISSSQFWYFKSKLVSFDKGMYCVQIIFPLEPVLYFTDQVFTSIDDAKTQTKLLSEKRLKELDALPKKEDHDE
jgi:hypothetical protein